MKKPNLKRMSKEEIEKNRIKAYTYATIKEEKMKTLLWLDDIRDPSVGDWLMSYAPEFAYGEGEVVWVKNFDDFVNHIKFKGMPDMISFDHDLGEDVAKERVSKGMSKRQARIKKRETKSGYDCSKWLVDYCLDNEIPIPKFGVHSANPVGAENIRKLLVNAMKHI
jgi:hypothetical protein